MPGSDDISEQGFEYWELASSNAKKMVAAASRAEVETLIATGQIMTAKLKDLNGATTYVCRSYAKTESQTVYGEEKEFTTDAYAGTGTVVSDSSKTAMWYVSLSGYRSKTPASGFNIVIFDDGSTEKIFVK